jgi:nicotinic acid phosphoribosyltransferase
MLELTLYDLQTTGTMPHSVPTATMKLNRHWTLRQWFQHFRRKLRTAFK